jgi:hypothetical protein
MKRTTTTLAALGLVLTGTVALAGADVPTGGRVERQPTDNPDPGPRGRPDMGGREARGGGMRDERRDERREVRPEQRRDDRREERRDERRDDRRDDRRNERRDERRDDRRDDRWDSRRDPRHDRRDDDRRRDDPRREDRHWDDRRWEGRGPSVSPRPGWSTRPPDRDRGSHYTWRDERGRDWRYRREWYDQYRADRWRYDRGRWFARERFTIGVYVFPRGYSVRYWQRGQWLPSVYYVERRWHLGDYWRYGLYDPPFDAGWVRVGDDALLVDLRSGEVLDAVYSLFW